MAANSRFAVAVHALAVIAWHEDARHSSREIASSVATNPVVIRRLLAQLSRAGIVESAHGAKGGFRLARPAGKIRLYDVYAAVEEGGFFALPEKGNDQCPVSCRMKAILDGVFKRVESKVVPELKRATLADVVGQLPRPA
ncbi:MAG: Rrf2 family transcriptional regulator [Elusimicrobia bacterium]|nr:Rrf2 family transcriptional regulator [Elusimicrobiota bacterium]